MDWWDFIRKYQTSLPQFDPKLDRDTGYAGVPPVQQVSAQPKEYTKDYLQGEYPDEFWSIVGNDPEDTKGHGGSRHRVDKDGNYVMVGVRGDSLVGDLPKRGPYRPRKGRKKYPQDYGVRVTQKKDMPSRRNIVVKPMNVKKEAKSPKALAHKRKYETEYESTPARKKYRRELERERRKRGVAGKGGGDMSHTKTGKIVVEDPHTNRARSHPSVGSTLKMVIVKAPQMNLDMESAQCASCNAMVDGQQAFASNRIFGETVCLACIQREQEKINQQNDMMYHSEPTDRTQQMTLDGQIVPSTRITIPVEDPAAVRQRIDTNTEKLRQKLEPRTNKEFAQDAEKAKQRRLKLHAMRAAGNTTLPRQ